MTHATAWPFDDLSTPEAVTAANYGRDNPAKHGDPRCPACRFSFVDHEGELCYTCSLILRGIV